MGYEVDLEKAVEASRAWDAERGIKASDPKGFVFHESRCGSTLAANSLAVADEAHRVYSESAPIPDAVRSSDPVRTLRDAVYLMIRGKGGEPVPTFFKVRSCNSVFI